jgi:hypothetical protein
MAAGGVVLGPSPFIEAADPPMLGIQVGAVSFVDEGTDKVLDNFREMAAIDTLFLATFTYGRGIAGRQPRGSALPDHGKQEYDDNYHGGNFATPHPQFYRGTTIAPEKAPDHPNYDVSRRPAGGAPPQHEIDTDIPTGAKEKKTQPDDVYAAVKAAFEGGAHGVLLSRKYSEMTLANLRAAGRAVRDLKMV